MVKHYGNGHESSKPIEGLNSVLFFTGVIHLLQFLFGQAAQRGCRKSRQGVAPPELRGSLDHSPSADRPVESVLRGRIFFTPTSISKIEFFYSFNDAVEKSVHRRIRR
jgi:hypothetical protein